MVNSGNISNVSISECNNSILNFSNGGNTNVNESKSGRTRPRKAGRRFECSRTKRKAVQSDGSDSDLQGDFADAMSDFEDAMENMLDDMSSTSRRRTAESYQGYTPPTGQMFISHDPWGWSNGMQSMNAYYHQYTQCAENIRQTMYAQQQSAQEQMRLTQEQAQWAREQARLARARRTGVSKPKKTKTETAKRTSLTTTPAPTMRGPDCAGSYKRTTIDPRGNVSNKPTHVQPMSVSGSDDWSRCPGYVEKEEVDERGGTKWVSRLCSHEECRRAELDPGVSSETMKVETKLSRRHRDKMAPRAKQQPSVEDVTDEDA
ncbi:hypothetical protein BDZ97DRAFT_1757835 [Flammula alnicola]|nr:hypothetical protein BDZ97DRAFT_1757835 [Flammula alnicola]